MKAFAVWSDEMAERWDLKGAQAAIFRAKHPAFVPFGTFIEEQSVLTRPLKDPTKEWPVYGVSNRDGVFLNQMQLGATFKASYKRIRRDWFFHNPTRANVGSLGRVPEVPADAITSPEYQVWSIKDPEWLPDYVEALIKMPFFNLLIQVHRVGAVKERLFTKNLMQIPVPVRDRAFQELLVAKWKAFQTELEEGERRITEHEEALVAEVLASAGIVINMPEAKPRAYAMEFDEVERWGVGFNRPRWTLESILGSNLYPRKPLSSVAMVNPRRTKKIDAESRVSFVPMEAVSEVSGSVEAAEDALIEEVSKGYTAFEDADLIWAKITPCMQNGKSAVARGLRNGLGFGSTEFHVIRSMDPEQTLPDYLWVLLRLRSIREAAKRYFIGSAGQQRVPSDFLQGLVIPLPPPGIQQSIVDGVLEKRKAVKEERAGLDALRAAKVSEIERDILTGAIT